MSLWKVVQLPKDDITPLLIELQALEIMRLQVGIPAASLDGNLLSPGQDP